MQQHESNKHYKFFSNRECEYYPCHENGNPDSFNCLFCYCPLYTLGRGCHGNFTYTEEDIKDCGKCLIPHGPHGYDYITSRFSLLKEFMQEKPPCQS